MARRREGLTLPDGRGGPRRAEARKQKAIPAGPSVADLIGRMVALDGRIGSTSVLRPHGCCGLMAWVRRGTSEYPLRLACGSCGKHLTWLRRDQLGGVAARLMDVARAAR